MLPTTFIFRDFLYSTLLPQFLCLPGLPSRVILHILLTQLFYATHNLPSCLSIRASISSPYKHAGTTCTSSTFFLINCFFSLLSHIIPSTLFHAATPAYITVCIGLLLRPSSHAVPPMQVHKAVQFFNDISVDNYMEVYLLFTFHLSTFR